MALFYPKQSINHRLGRNLCDLHSVLLASLLFSVLPTFAQPSGGPYGPIAQCYELPKGAKQVYYVAPDGLSKAKGGTPEKPTTLDEAFKRVKTGDVIVLRGGTYRAGGFLLNQGITMQPYKDEQPVLKGTRIATKWTPLRDNIWRTKWATLFPDKPQSWWRREREGARTPQHRFNNDMVFVDGRFLQSAGWEGEVDENSYYINYETGEVFIGVNPQDKLVEITAFNSAFVRTIGKCHGKTSDKKGPIIRGITFTQYAYRAIEIEAVEPEGLMDEADFGKDVVGTLIEHCAITFCSRVAGYFRGDGFTMRHCLISDTSTEGVYILNSADTLLEKNIIRRNNIEKITGYFPSAVKIFNQSYRATCRDNLVIDHPDSNGIWYDVGNVDGVFVNNWMQNIGMNHDPVVDGRSWPKPNRSAFFFEISKGAICAGNVFFNCDHGIFVLNSCDVKMYQNTCINSRVIIKRDTRSAAGDHFGWHPSTGPDVHERDGHILVNNLLTGDAHFTSPLLSVEQAPVLCARLNKPQFKHLDYNTYVRRADTDMPLIQWSPVQNAACQADLDSPKELQRMHPKFAAHSSSFAAYEGPLFKSEELGNYELQKAFQKTVPAGKLSPELRILLGLPSKTDDPYTGAYPPEH